MNICTPIYVSCISGSGTRYKGPLLNYKEEIVHEIVSTIICPYTSTKIETKRPSLYCYILLSCLVCQKSYFMFSVSLVET